MRVPLHAHGKVGTLTLESTLPGAELVGLDVVCPSEKIGPGDHSFTITNVVGKQRSTSTFSLEADSPYIEVGIGGLDPKFALDGSRAVYQSQSLVDGKTALSLVFLDLVEAKVIARRQHVFEHLRGNLWVTLGRNEYAIYFNDEEISVIYTIAEGKEVLRVVGRATFISPFCLETQAYIALSPSFEPIYHTRFWEHFNMALTHSIAKGDRREQPPVSNIFPFRDGLYSYDDGTLVGYSLNAYSNRAQRNASGYLGHTDHLPFPRAGWRYSGGEVRALHFFQQPLMLLSEYPSDRVVRIKVLNRNTGTTLSAVEFTVPTEYATEWAASRFFGAGSYVYLKCGNRLYYANHKVPQSRIDEIPVLISAQSAYLGTREKPHAANIPIHARGAFEEGSLEVRWLDQSITLDKTTMTLKTTREEFVKGFIPMIEAPFLSDRFGRAPSGLHHLRLSSCTDVLASHFGAVQTQIDGEDALLVTASPILLHKINQSNLHAIGVPIVLGFTDTEIRDVVSAAVKREMVRLKALIEKARANPNDPENRAIKVDGVESALKMYRVFLKGHND
ncbi:MAG: hypothetical protein KDB07_06930 [Planctomycetes bacterium]|nr:hypothetical protein [Planctomycetota bacterium]